MFECEQPILGDNVNNESRSVCGVRFSLADEFTVWSVTNAFEPYSVFVSLLGLQTKSIWNFLVFQMNQLICAVLFPSCV